MTFQIEIIFKSSICILDTKRECLKVNFPPIQEQYFGYVNGLGIKLSSTFSQLPCFIIFSVIRKLRKIIYTSQYKRAIAGNQSWFLVQVSVKLQDRIQVGWKSIQLYFQPESYFKINIFCYSYVKSKEVCLVIVQARVISVLLSQISGVLFSGQFQ